MKDDNALADANFFPDGEKCEVPHLEPYPRPATIIFKKTMMNILKLLHNNRLI